MLIEIMIKFKNKIIINFQFTCYAENVLGQNKSNIAAPSDVLSAPPKEGGMSPGIVVVIILAVTFVLVGLPYAYYKFCS